MSEVQEFWKLGYIQKDFNYEEYVPWLNWKPTQSKRAITLNRGAELVPSSGKYMVTINTSPRVIQIAPVGRGSMVQFLTYGDPFVQAATINLTPKGPGFFQISTTGWQGSAPRQPGWASLGEKGVMPEPRAQLFTRLRSIPRVTAESLGVGKPLDKPTLLAINLLSSAPVLYLPDVVVAARVFPLIDSGFELEPTEKLNTISGYMIQKGDGQQLIRSLPSGFKAKPISGKGTRDGNLVDFFG
jgi:hypothetical protein